VVTATLVAVLAAFSLLFSITDSVVGRDSRLYYCVATPHGFNVFNFSGKQEEQEWALGELQKLHLRPLDYVHVIVAGVVFLTVAFSDASLQRCFFPNASNNTQRASQEPASGDGFPIKLCLHDLPDKMEGHWIQRYNCWQKDMKRVTQKFRCEIGHVYS
jgi:hypothetical protein